MVAPACSPVPAPARDHLDDAAVVAGDPIPDFSLETRDGAPLSAADLIGRPAVIVFVASDPVATDRYLTRIDDTFERLGSEADNFRRLAVLLPGPTLPTWSRPGWTSLIGSEAAVRDLARRFGVTQWESAVPAQNFTVTVFNPVGRAEKRFGGLAMWTEMDLLVALDRAVAQRPR